MHWVQFVFESELLFRKFIVSMVKYSVLDKILTVIDGNLFEFSRKKILAKILKDKIKMINGKLFKVVMREVATL